MPYQITITHSGLNKIRRISGNDKWLVEERARVQKAAWDKQWTIRLENERRRTVRTNTTLLKDGKKKLAAERTAEAQQLLSEVQRVLAARQGSMKIWEKLKDTSKFAEAKPKEPFQPAVASEPNQSDLQYLPSYGFLDYVFPPRKRRKLDASAEKFSHDHAKWQEEKARQEEEYKSAKETYHANLAAWEAQRIAFSREQEARNAEISEMASRYGQKDPEAVKIYNDLVLSESEFPECCPKEHEIHFVPESGILVLDYRLPAVGDIPRLKQVKYISARDALEESQLRQQEIQSIYDDLMYQICLRVIYEVFAHDLAKAVEAVVFNGWVDFIDPATGKDACSCIMSVQAAGDEFSSLNLDHVDAKACFKALKGVGSSKLYGMASVAPIMRINKEDARFIANVDVVDGVDQGTNLAAIGWEDFEFLIREIFEKEFSKNGGEVKVTRASRDGGVDAVAFDPDPIRGGKIVIQAKRYTNTVGVSAVRDLYGTVMNEGATKGILVTTAAYGPDAYAFAKDKPLTLLDGGNLLYLLQQHGHKAYINLAEAKQMNPQPFMRSTRQ